jgi:hypothetical protein
VTTQPHPGGTVERPDRDRWEPTAVRWYPVVNDLVGGWAVSHVDKPLSEQDWRKGDGDIADFCSELVARHIADLHNAWVTAQLGSGRDDG